MTRPAALDVYVDLDGDQLLAGTASLAYPGGVQSTTSFTYAETYLADPRSYALEPRLPLYRSPARFEGLPAAFEDSTPDWWGRHLIDRKLALEAGASGQPRPWVTAVDYLIGVMDATRQGAVRYAPAGTTRFLAPDEADVPAQIALPELLEASDRVIASTDEDVLTELRLLLRAGSGDLGGARPKASVRVDGRLSVAKFPQHSDEWDVMAWEKTALDLAQLCGIQVPRRQLISIGGRHVLLLNRFDRDADGDRVGYVSVRTLAEKRSSAGNDYLDMATAIEDHSAATEADLRETWTRIAFTVAINNTDDHFHNHGFLQAAGGWVLSPAFDININPDLGDRRSTGLSGAALRRETLRMLVSQAAFFGLSASAAREGLDAVAAAVTGWRHVATSNGVPARELTSVGWVLDDFLAEVAALPTT